MRTRSFALSCALLAPLSLLPLQVYATVPSGSAAQIVSLQGDGEQRTSDAQPWAAAKTTQLLPGGAYVRTLAGAKMALLFADDTQVRLNQNSVLQVKRLADAAQPTTLMLSLGRAWAQTKRFDGSRLNLQTPAATAGIRGTDWELDVDGNGKTLLTVLSGTVEFANAQGAVTVGSNEAALAEVGRAPVKIQLSSPRDRIQWVNALTADPTRHLHADQVPATPDGPWQAILASARAIQSGDSAGARRQLNALVEAPQGAPAAAYLMLSDLQLVDGAFDAAANTLESGLVRHPGDADLLAQLTKTYLLADRLDDGAKVLARTRNADTASVLLAQGELARRQGQAAATEEAFARATRVAPLDDRGWFGLGSAQNEREAITPARANLQKALELKPQGAGYRGELGTLETFANRFDQADAAFAKALEDNPADYVSWTGLGLLRLKQGQPQAALDAFLRAGVMEPRYARAKTYTGVAYYQLGRHADAIDTLRQSTVLDDKDPLPYVFLSQIYTDLFQAGDAVQASREAVRRLPYLKSLNQVANDQKGSANFGSALAFFGLEDWALELAQDSYYPYWGGSHLFLADRYPGEFNKNSELFQGFLSDPLAFGASNRFSSLLQRSGHHGALGLNVEKSQWHLQTPSLTLNGLFNETVPIAYFLQTQPVSGSDFPIDVVVPNNVPTFADSTGRANVQARVTTFGLGVQPTERLGLFAYFNEFKASLQGANTVIGADTGTAFDHVVRHRALGLSYRWSPTEQTWFKLGSSNETTEIQGYPTLIGANNAVGLLGLSAQPAKNFDDIQIRHTLDLSPATRVSVGLERVNESQANAMQGSGVVTVFSGDQQASDILGMSGTNDIDRHFTALTLAAQHRPTSSLLLDGAVTANRLVDNSVGRNDFVLWFSDVTTGDRLRVASTTDQTAARIGVAYKPHDQFTLRAAYQDWVRPLSVSTLGSVETAGIPIEDRLVEAGGRLKRGVVQMGWTPREDTFLSVKLDRMDVHNLTSPGVDLRTPGLPFLEQLRNAQTVNLSSMDALEDTPSFEDGTMSALTLSASRMFSKQFSGYAKYTLQDTSSSYEDSEAPGGRVTDKRIPYMPRETAILGATLAAGSRTYLGARAVYRSERFEDQGNMTPWPAGWSLDLVGFWETADKHWVIGLGALNLGGVKSNRQTDRYVLDARYRF